MNIKIKCFGFFFYAQIVKYSIKWHFEEHQVNIISLSFELLQNFVKKNTRKWNKDTLVYLIAFFTNR